MKLSPFFASLCALILWNGSNLSSVWAKTDDLTPDAQAGDFLKTTYDELRPTQFAVGMVDVADKIKELSDLSGDDLKDYLKKKEIPIVIHDGKYYQIDHHHLVFAIDQEIGDHQRVYVRVVENWSGMGDDAFWDKMFKQGYFRPYDEQGRGPLSWKELPKKISKLKDDPYRSLAYSVRQAGGFIKSKVPFAEFMHADFYRERIPLSLVRTNYDAAVKRGLELEKTPEAAKLPGNPQNGCGGRLR